MRREPAEESRDDADLISEMGRERMALRARNTTVVLTVACSFVCLAAALAGFTGFVLPHAAGPATVFLAAATAGFVLSITVAEHPEW
jgi:hypothetical protein